MSNVPGELKYTKEHEWLREEAEGVYIVGITEHAQELLGDMVFVDLPQVGSVVAQGADCAVAESVKAASDIYAPISGEIVEVNAALEDSPEQVNSEPYGAGWIFKIKASEAGELSALLDAGHRLALVGDAAHTIHPLAGQGVNLGFMDAAELVAEVRRLHREGKDFGQHLYLRRYERSRKHSAVVMLASMQGFRELFAGHSPAKKWLRDVGLKLADTLPGIKTRLVRQAMGLDDLPSWLR